MRLKKIWYPQQNKEHISRKLKKTLKKSQFGFTSYNFKHIYKLQKRWERDFVPDYKIVRRGNNIWCKSFDGILWKLVYSNHKIVNKELCY